MEQKRMEAPAPPEKDFLPRLGAGCLMLVGALVVLVGMALIPKPGNVDLLGVLFYCLLGTGFIAAGIFWYRYVSQQEGTRRRLFEEKSILTVAARHGGYATLAQVMLDTPFTAAEAEGAMARLCREGFARPEVLDDGTIRYRFGGLLAE